MGKLLLRVHGVAADDFSLPIHGFQPCWRRADFILFFCHGRLRQCEVGGRLLQGEQVQSLCLAARNRAPARFARPDCRAVRRRLTAGSGTRSLAVRVPRAAALIGTNAETCRDEHPLSAQLQLLAQPPSTIRRPVGDLRRGLRAGQLVTMHNHSSSPSLTPRGTR